MANYHTLLSHLLCEERYKKRCLQSVYIPCRDNLLLKSLLISSPLPYSVDFSAVYAQVNLWKQQWGREREVIHVFYPANKRSINSEGSELQRTCEWAGKPRGALASPLAWLPATPQMESLLTGYKYSWTHIDYIVFSESVSTNDDLDCSYPWSHPLL